MPLLSIVLPVYRVQAYLRECLDSLLGQPFTDIEVIAVDDCSPDHCGAILDEYAARDPRVRVLHLAENVGLGQARNEGQRHATGEFVWFVDSDDWIAPGALAAIAARIGETDPDVLVVDYAKVWWNHKSKRSKLAELIRTEGLPRLFTLAEYPNALKIFHVAWNKIYRRTFLEQHRITYPGGLYEDVPVGFPVLILADRITVLERVCVYYRQRRRGAITSTPGRGHFHALDQYDLLFARLDEIGERAAPYRAIIFERMLHQCLLVLENPERIADEDRKDFFQALAQAYARHLPAGGYTPREGPAGEKQRLLERGSYTGWLARRAATRVRGAVKRRTREVERELRIDERVRRKYYQAQLRQPVDENLALISNVNFPGWVEKREDAIHLSTNHGTPVKAMGIDQLKYPAGVTGMNMAWLLKRCDRWSFSISPNAYTTEVWERAYPCDYETLEYGYPRNDALVNATERDVAEARARVGVHPGQTAVAYLPTYRDYEFGSDALLNVERFADQLPDDTVVLARVHHFDRSHVSGDHPRVLDLSDHPSVEDVCLAADVLITDYSSVMFDYAVLDRPMAIYAADWEKYRENRGAYLDVFRDGPGVTARTPDELAGMFRSGEVRGPVADLNRAVFRDRFCYLDDGHAAERVVRRVFLDEPVITPARAMSRVIVGGR
ncbi:CDP-glycerol glycerophosphotransferase family protein [Actinoplanes sp. G11-F43]|uniref:bifunctional glycosyltransferase/CDP-glycerol:glycerophosphate glycerophosphotransferase n=1 Tax=Actinoplanes sp. G11-F43 TaxID=3424130 RepID=UPI003D334ADB